MHSHNRTTIAHKLLKNFSGSYNPHFHLLSKNTPFHINPLRITNISTHIQLPTTRKVSSTHTIPLFTTAPQHTLLTRYFAMNYSTETPKQTQPTNDKKETEQQQNELTPDSTPLLTNTTQTTEPDSNSIVSSFKNKIKTFVKKYGPIGLITYFTLYYATWASLYFAVDGGYIISNNVIQTLSSWGLDKWFDLSTLNSKAGSVAVSWVLTKFTEPLRVAITVAITPTLVKWWTNKKTEK
eukprot:TRINITY_DN2839_c0_g2_i2.p1 TRINITY_DN2839_c0_g2~~TRINITY_DN2839_c0_g2_i2.p1  ORF type:complete len:279 (+),score=46.27 TRINITY_DN2839_c0_g2_i2:125-838(+)